MLLLIKRLIGKYTLKKFIKKGVYVDETGDYWVETISPKHLTIDLKEFFTRTYPHTYRELRQNGFGVWGEVDSWLSKHSPLEKLVIGKQNEAV